jgi:ATP-dependent DNA helicase RecG
MTPQVTARVTAEITAQVAAFGHGPQSAKAIVTEPGLKHWETLQANYLAPLMTMGILERIIPGKPRNRMQRYRTTEAGLEMATGHASGRLPVLPEKPPGGGRGNGS